MDRLAPSLLWANLNGFKVPLSTFRHAYYTIFHCKSQLILICFLNIFQKIFELTDYFLAAARAGQYNRPCNQFLYLFLIDYLITTRQLSYHSINLSTYIKSFNLRAFFNLSAAALLCSSVRLDFTVFALKEINFFGTIKNTPTTFPS